VAFHCADKNMPPRKCKPPRRYRDEELVHGNGGEAPPHPPPPPPQPFPPPPPPPMPDLGQFVAALIAAIPRQVENVDAIGCSSIAFFKHIPPVFNGSEGPLEADEWITSFEDLANTLSCKEDQRVNYVGLSLKGEARHWWKDTKTQLTEELGRGVPITWERFKNEFNDRFFPRAQQQQCAR
jgi:hypothetical protein